MQRLEPLPRARSVHLPALSFSIIRPLPVGMVVFVISALAYLLVAWYVVYVAHVVVGDAWSRVGNAYYVLFSRDPHLAAIGFVWNPLPALAVMPLLPFKTVFPGLVTEGFAANILSALFMAGAVYQIWGTLGDLRLRSSLRTGLTVLLAVHPMLIYYAANGMSEAPFLFFLVVTSRYLARWIGTANVSALVVAALGLALAYLTRYEAAAAAGAASLLVLSVSAFRTTGDRRSRLLAGLADALIIAVPFAAVFIGWALASWIIVGSPFETFTSIYGNSSQVGLAARYIRESTGQGTAAGAGYVASQLFGLEPLLLPCAAIALVAGLVRRDLRILAPLAVMCAVLGFAAWAFLDGKSFGWLRFYIAAIPLMVIVCGSLLANSAVAPTRRRGRLRFASRLTVAALLTSIALLGSGVAVIWGGRTMLTPNLGREENGQVAAAIGGGALARAISPEVRLYDLAGTVAANLDRRHLARGSVLVDVATGFPVVLRSNDPTQFVITPDRDFEAAVADPTSFGVEYLLVPGGGSAVLDAISRAHPGVYADGGGIGELVGDFSDGTGAGGWRLYRLIR